MTPGSRQPRIAHCVGFYFPDQVGGTEVYVQDLLSELAKREVDGYVVAATNEVYRRYDWQGVPVIRYPEQLGEHPRVRADAPARGSQQVPGADPRESPGHLPPPFLDQRRGPQPSVADRAARHSLHRHHARAVGPVHARHHAAARPPGMRRPDRREALRAMLVGAGAACRRRSPSRCRGCRGMSFEGGPTSSAVARGDPAVGPLARRRPGARAAPDGRLSARRSWRPAAGSMRACWPTASPPVSSRSRGRASPAAGRGSGARRAQAAVGGTHRRLRRPAGALQGRAYPAGGDGADSQASAASPARRRQRHRAGVSAQLIVGGGAGQAHRVPAARSRARKSPISCAASTSSPCPPTTWRPVRWSCWKRRPSASR